MVKKALTNLAKDSTQMFDGFQNSRLNVIVSNLAAEAVPGGIYLLKVDNRNSRQRSEICSKLSFMLTLNIFHTLF